MEMRNIIIAFLVISASLLVGCGGAAGNDPGHAYMPDMYYSRAYETYGYNDVGGEYDSLKARGITYTALPVPGTIARGDMVEHMTNDSAGLAASNSLVNPLDTMANAKVDMKEAERLYLVNCGVCHGPKLDGKGPLVSSADPAYLAVPRNLTDDYTKALTDGHIFHVITYGIRAMGAYGSQLRPEQRWMVVKYIRSKQGGGAAAAGAATPTTTAAATDSTSTNP